MSSRSARIPLTTALILVVMTVAACGASTGPTPRPTPPAALPGTSWELGAQGGTAPAANIQPTLVFGSDGTVSGNDSCDNYTGAFTVDGGKLTFTGLKTTNQAECAPEVAAKATAFRAALGATTSWRATSADDVPLPSGVLVLSPVKLVLSGAQDLIFSQH